MLYPLKFHPILKKKIWGGERLAYKSKEHDESIGESWEISAVEDNISVVSNGILADNDLQELIEVYMGDLVGDHIYEKFGVEFPLLIKYIDANDDLSIQVHPDDETAKERHNAYGKTEMWYIVDAAGGAGIYYGFKRDTSKEEFLKYLEEGKVEELLNFIPVKKGESYFIPAGTVHAIGAGCLICEIQQNSNLTYRVYDYNRRGADGKLRELHVDKAVKVMNFKKYAPVSFASGNKKDEKTLAECKYFRVREVELSGEKEFYDENSFTALTVVSGSGKICGGGYAGEFSKGDSFFVSCKTDFKIDGKATVIVTDVPDTNA